MNKYFIMPHRELKRVPLDFDWPLKKLWMGYCFSSPLCGASRNEGCELCEKYQAIMNVQCDEATCKNFDPPTGEGYQAWETCSEGSPISPVFKTLGELLEWCSIYETIFGNETGSIEDWRKLLIDGEPTPLHKNQRSE